MSVFTAPAPFGGPQLLLALQVLGNSSLTISTSPTALYQAFIAAIQRSNVAFMQLGEFLSFQVLHDMGENQVKVIDKSESTGIFRMFTCISLFH